MRTSVRLLITFFCSILFISCGSSPPEEPSNPQAPAGTYQYLKAKMLPQCLSCHGVNSPTGYDFSSYSSVMASGVVVAKNPRSSALFVAVNTGSMPKGGAKLPQSIIDAVETWIKNGAQNN